MNSVSDCIEEANRRVHDCHTKKRSKELREKYVDNNTLAKQRRLEDFLK